MDFIDKLERQKALRNSAELSEKWEEDRDWLVGAFAEGIQRKKARELEHRQQMQKKKAKKNRKKGKR